MLTLDNKNFASRIIMGTALYPSLEILHQSIQTSQTQIITVSIKKEKNHDHNNSQSFWSLIREFNCTILPNTAGCKTAEEAIATAEIAREVFDTNWIKLEVIGDTYLLHPHPFELVKAAKELIKRGFTVFPYCTEDLILCNALVDVGCNILMPWGAPIGSGKGLLNRFHLKILRERLPQITLIIDAGIGTPAHAIDAMLLGYDAVLVNSAIAKANDPVMMAKAFAKAVDSGRLAYAAGIMPESDFAIASTPLHETLFWQN